MNNLENLWGGKVGDFKNYTQNQGVMHYALHVFMWFEFCGRRENEESIRDVGQCGSVAGLLSSGVSED